MRALILVAALLAACASPASPTPSGGNSALAAQIRADLARSDAELSASGIVAAGIGETADLGGGLTIRPLSVKQDSRCPHNVQCVWAGQLILHANVSGTEQDLILGQPLTTPRGAVLLAVASPNAWSEWPPELGPKPAYRFGFRRP